MARRIQMPIHERAVMYLRTNCHQWDCAAFKVGDRQPINHAACDCGLKYIKDCVANNQPSPTPGRLL